MPSPEFRRLVTAGVAVSALAFWAVVLTLAIIYSFSESPSDFLTSEGLRYVMPGLTGLIGALMAAVYALPGSALQRLGNLLATDGPRKALTANKRLAAVAFKVVYLLGGAMALATWIATGADTIEFVRTVAVVWGGTVVAMLVAYYD